MKLKARKTPFLSEAGENAFLALLNDGPLARIFSNEKLRLAPAKGSSRFRKDFSKYANIYDQTYFAHSLNVSITAGILFEAAVYKLSNEHPTEREIRIVLAAGSIHDFNKLPFFGMKSLPHGFREFREETNISIDSNDIEIITMFCKRKTFFMVVWLLVDIPSFIANNEILALCWIPWDTFIDALYNTQTITCDEHTYGLRRAMKTLKC